MAIQGGRSARIGGARSLRSAWKGVIVGAVAGGALLVLGRFLHIWHRLRVLDRQGQRLSAQHTETHPTTNFSHDGKPSDPLNVQFIASSGQIGGAFAAAGWYRADEIDLITSVRMLIDTLCAASYSSAPVSNLYLYGRRQDIAYERPGKNVRARDHIRLWDTGQRSDDGRSIWIGGATKDIKIEVSPLKHLHAPTHAIAPDPDTERATIEDDLVSTGWVLDTAWQAGFGMPTQTHNAVGDPYYTDGQIVVLRLADSTVPWFGKPLRALLGARITRSIAKRRRR